jgi:ATPase family protein associated with various cellular activities (AAA)
VLTLGPRRLQHMTIHKLNTEAAAKAASPLDIGVVLHHEEHSFLDTIVRARVARLISGAPSRFPVYRLMRCAVRSKLEPLFDDIAMKSGVEAHRLGGGSVLLDGPGLLASVWGARRTGYASFVAHVYADSPARAEELQDALVNIIGERRVVEPMFVIDWQFSTGHGLNNATFEEMSDGPLLDEAYPMLGEPVQTFIDRYLDAPETVLVLQGPPGTGKTRLVRAVLAGLSARKGESAEVMYTADRGVLEKDEIFVEFITGSHDAFVIEDADHMLMARSNGNVDLHRFLAVADGVVRAQGRKIIFTTNLPNIGDIDEALLRPGRCFTSIHMRTLLRDEVTRLVAKLCGDDAQRVSTVVEKALPNGARSAALANVFRALA